MPCYDGRDSDCSGQYERGFEEAKRAATHNSPVAELLCYVLSNLDEYTRMTMCAANPALNQWWEVHQHRDQAKRQAEQREALARAAKNVRKRERQAVIDKLSPAERKLLGL